MNQTQLLVKLKEQLPQLTFGKKPQPFAEEVIRIFLYHNNQILIKHQISNVNHGCQVIKLEDDWVKYLIVMPEGSYEDQPCDQFIWFTGPEFDQESNAITPDQASIYLVSRLFPDIKMRSIKSDDLDITLLTIGEQLIEVKWPQKLTDPETWRRNKI